MTWKVKMIHYLRYIKSEKEMEMDGNTIINFPPYIFNKTLQELKENGRENMKEILKEEEE